MRYENLWEKTPKQNANLDKTMEDIARAETEIEHSSIGKCKFKLCNHGDKCWMCARVGVCVCVCECCEKSLSEVFHLFFPFFISCFFFFPENLLIGSHGYLLGHHTKRCFVAVLPFLPPPEQPAANQSESVHFHFLHSPVLVLCYAVCYALRLFVFFSQESCRA